MGNFYTFSHFFTQKMKNSHLNVSHLGVLANIFGLYYNYESKRRTKQAFKLIILDERQAQFTQEWEKVGQTPLFCGKRE